VLSGALNRQTTPQIAQGLQMAIEEARSALASICTKVSP
jgi:hypothetical protein